MESRFLEELVDASPLRVRSSLMLSQLLKSIGFHDVVQRWCADDGDVPCSVVLEAYIHCRYNEPKPCPVSRFQAWYQASCLPALLGVPPEKMNESRVGRVLELVGDAPQEMWLELIANTHKVHKLDISYLINDTTSFYFEGEYEHSELAKYGYSRDGKPECKQVNVSVNVTGLHGIPVQYFVVPGNTADISTVIPNVAKLRRLFQALGEAGERIVVVSDKGLLDMPLLHYYTKTGVGYIATMKCPKVEAGFIRKVSDAELKSSPLSYLAARYRGKPEKEKSEKYCAVRRQVQLPAFTEEGTKTEYPAIDVSALIVFSMGKERLDRQKRADLLEKEEARLREIAGYLNTGNYRNEGFAQNQITKAINKYPAIRGMILANLNVDDDGLLSLKWTRCNEAIDKAAELDGKYVVYFSEKDKTDEEVFQMFKSRDRVEKRIETIKGPIVVRPIYLHKDSRIKGLIFASMAALLLYGLTELLAWRDNKKISGEEIQKQLEDYEGSVLTFSDGSRVLSFPQGNRWQSELHEAMGVRTGHRVTLRGPEASKLEPPCPWTTRGQT